MSGRFLGGSNRLLVQTEKLINTDFWSENSNKSGTTPELLVGLKRRVDQSTRALEPIRMIYDLEAGVQDSVRSCEKSEFPCFSP